MVGNLDVTQVNLNVTQVNLIWPCNIINQRV